MPCLSLAHIYAARANGKRHKFISVKFDFKKLGQIALNAFSRPETTSVNTPVNLQTIQIPVASKPLDRSDIIKKLKSAPLLRGSLSHIAAREWQKFLQISAAKPDIEVAKIIPIAAQNSSSQIKSASAQATEVVTKAVEPTNLAHQPAISSNTISRADKRKAKRLERAQARQARKDFLRLLPKGRYSSRADLINAESQLGSTIFGPVPAGHRREFFHDRANIWIWHEDWYDATLRHRQITVRYEVRVSGIYKKIAAGQYYKLEGDELANFRLATRVYLYLIRRYLYPKAPVLA